MDDVIKIWNDALVFLEQETNAITYETWFLPVIPYTIEGDIFYLQTDNDVTKDMLDKKYSDLIINTLRHVTKKTFQLYVLTGDERPKKQTNLGDLTTKNIIPRNLNPKYVFSSFVVGNSNQMAHAASLAVAQSPAKNYNPLFLYGNSGLGKTHLMHSIAHYILEENPESKVLYVTSETFTNELILSIQNNKNEAFRNKYRNIDVLLIDDIQFISKKEGTQEEFFHTFNSLYESSKQIIISSDRPPKEIKTLEDRLRGRFEMGLIADIQPPDYETRIAILNKKADTDHLEVPREVLAYIAKNIASNIRELEGALTRIVAFATLTNEHISLSLAENSLKDIFSDNVTIVITPALIQEIVATHYDILVEDMVGSKKPKNIAFPRQIAMYLCRKLLDISLPKIGENFGGRDHTTVIHAVSKIEKQIEKDPSLQTVIQQIEKKIKGE